MQKHAFLTIWLFFFGLFALLLSELRQINLLTLDTLLALDSTGTTLFIIVVFIIGLTFSIGNIVWLTRLILKDREALLNSVHDIELSFECRQILMSYINGYLPILGFLGTLIGFMLIATIFEHKIVGETDLAKIIGYIQESVGGIKTAAFTSIIGMLTSWSCLMLLNTVFRLGYMRMIVRELNVEHNNENS
ncbi:hypothetical protein HYS99_01695 [Candidatus Giovannonibacteria bacterium]|nr:hypothetical protein [Candidatus Giovannonibacteria bacterium]